MAIVSPDPSPANCSQLVKLEQLAPQLLVLQFEPAWFATNCQSGSIPSHDCPIGSAGRPRSSGRKGQLLVIFLRFIMAVNSHQPTATLRRGNILLSCRCRGQGRRAYSPQQAPDLGGESWLDHHGGAGRTRNCCRCTRAWRDRGDGQHLGGGLALQCLRAQRGYFRAGADEVHRRAQRLTVGVSHRSRAGSLRAPRRPPRARLGLSLPTNAALRCVAFIHWPCGCVIHMSCLISLSPPSCTRLPSANEQRKSRVSSAPLMD